MTRLQQLIDAIPERKTPPRKVKGYYLYDGVQYTSDTHADSLAHEDEATRYLAIIRAYHEALWLTLGNVTAPGLCDEAYKLITRFDKEFGQ